MKKLENISQKTRMCLLQLKDKIAENDFEGVYSYLSINLPKGESGEVIPQLTRILYTSGLDPLKKMDRVPQHFLQDCEDITEFEIPSNITTIGEYAFSDCRLKEIKIPPMVTKIGANAFLWNEDLKNIYFSDPSHKLHLDVACFGACVNLENIYFDGSEKEFNAVMIRSMPFADLDTAIKLIFDRTIGGKIIEGEINVHYTR